ncbi:ATP-binding cassette domain-containing protein [Streptomyces sp. J2-1]|uniref:ATP-binding cassette domain-containing protein n=1 Tax=Streptomyces corallincola TaxID=2851888 RepID=UPI001C381638|nr:ATP-binding cassette domain-containing protein [Streptomyces corallincola]MBV2355613.1 ATP-binding cassette domain-containing protein [Streptomyces corallincola]
MDGVRVTAGGLGLKGPRGYAFRGVDLDAEAGELIALTGPSGSGRTSLLLTLTGRMRPTEGVAAIDGLELPRRMHRVRGLASVANVAGVTDLEPALTVGEHLREQALLLRRFTGTPRALPRPRAERARETRERVDAALAAVGLDPDALPKGARTAVRDLERPQELRLSLALALLTRPRLLGVDDVDLKLSAGERADLWALLGALARSGVTVLAVCRDAPADIRALSTARPDTTTHPDTPDHPKGTAPDAHAQPRRA